MPLHPKTTLSMRPVLKRAGLPVEDRLPWDGIRWESFGAMDDMPLPEIQSFGVLEDGDEAWPELEEWLGLHPDEPKDIGNEDWEIPANTSGHAIRFPARQPVSGVVGIRSFLRH